MYLGNYQYLFNYDYTYERISKEHNIIQNYMSIIIVGTYINYLQYVQ